MIAERTADGWHTRTGGEARDAADRIVHGLRDRDLVDRPIMLLSGNGIEHVLLTLAGLTLGVAVVPVSVAYSVQSRDHATLRSRAELVDPGMVFAADPAPFAAALRAVGDGRQIVTAGLGTTYQLGLDQLRTTSLTSGVDQCCARIRPDDVAKILFTSGSTGTLKIALTTHRMRPANQPQIRQVWPFLAYEAPVLLDWLPWSHTVGGNHNLGTVLANGGTLWIDDGRPVPGLIERTVANLADVSPTIYFNVPAGYAALVPILERDTEAAARFFAKLRLGFFAASALPSNSRTG